MEVREREGVKREVMEKRGKGWLKVREGEIVVSGGDARPNVKDGDEMKS